jgi:hypothetical protein
MPKSLQFEPYMPNWVMRETNCMVRSGPFQGMKYTAKSAGSVLIPKLLGIYERELHPVLEYAISHPFQVIVDIGAAEGYYCVGLARRMPQTRVVAYEMDEAGRQQLKELARLNHVSDQLEIRGLCTMEEMNSVLDASVSTLLICDVEGAEAYLLDSLRVPALVSMHILVELHDFVLGGLSDVMHSRFQATHEIEHIWQEGRSRSDFPYRSFYTRCFPSYMDIAVSEGRPCRMSWYWMRPKHEPETLAAL